MGRRLILATMLALVVPLAACESLRLEPNHYACDRSLGDAECPFGMHCGQEGFCYERSDAGAVACEQDKEDCAADWRCDLSGRCRPRAPGAHACAVDGGLPGSLSDAGVTPDELCEGWRCGIDDVCHPREEGPWPCRVDPDCEGSWRCGVDGVCISALGEDLDFVSFPDAGAPELLNPSVLPLHPPQFAASGPYTGRFEDFDVTLRAVAYSEPQSTGAQATWMLALSGRNVFTNELSNDLLPHRVQLPGNPKALAATPFALFLISPGPQADVVAYQPVDDGGMTITWVKPVTGTELVPLSDTNQGASPVVTLTPGSPAASYAHVFGSEALRLPEVDAKSDGGLWLAFEDAKPLTWGFFARHLVVATTRGLHAVPVSTLAFDGFLSGGGATANYCEFAETTNALLFSRAPASQQAAQGFGVRLRARPSARTDESPLIAVSIREVRPAMSPSPNTTYVTKLYLMDNGPPISLGDAGTLTNACAQGIPQRIILGPCENPCARGEVLDFSPLPIVPGAGAAIDVRCRSNDVGVSDYTIAVRQIPGSTACASAAPGEDPFQFDHVTAAAGSTGGAWLGAHGQLWLGPSTSEATSFTLERAPVGLELGGGGSLLVGVLPDGFAVHGPAGFVASSDRSATTDRVVAAVEGRPFWYVAESGYVIDLAPNSGDAQVRAYATQPLTLPVRAAMAPRADGGSHLVLTSRDRLYAATIHDVQGDGGTPAPLEQRLVPAPTQDISAIGTLNGFTFPDGGVPLSASYILAGDRVFRVTAETDFKWRSTEVAVPEGELSDLWTDGAGKARLAYSDGRIVSLPSGLQLVAPWDVADPTPAADVIDLCGQPWAVSGLNLYRAVKDPLVANTARWEQFSFGGLQPASALYYLGTQSRLYHRGFALFLVTSFGVTVRIPTECDGGGVAP